MSGHDPVYCCVEFFSDDFPKARNGGIGLNGSGELVVFCDDDYYNGRVNPEDTLKLARAILKQEPFDVIW